MSVSGTQSAQNKPFTSRVPRRWPVLKLMGAATTAAAVYFGGTSLNWIPVSRKAIPPGCAPSSSLNPYETAMRVRQSPLPPFEYEERTPHPGLILTAQGTTGYPIVKSALRKMHGFFSQFSQYAEEQFSNEPEILRAKAASLTADSKGYGVGGTDPETGEIIKATLAISPQKFPNQKAAIKLADRIAREASSSSAEQTRGRILALHETALKGFAQANPGHFRKEVSVVFKDDHTEHSESGLIAAVRARGTAQDVEIFRKQVVPKIKKNALSKLTPREKEVFGLVAALNPPPEEIPGLMKEFATQLNAGFRQMAECGNFDPVGFAAWAHQRFSEIHPFGDGNGRVARLLQNAILKAANYPPVVFDSDDGYMQAVNRDFDEPGTYARYLKEQIDWTQRELIDADPCLPELTC